MTDSLLLDAALPPPLPLFAFHSPKPDEAHPDILLGPVRPGLIRAEVLADLLEATAVRVPEKTALIFGERSLTYRELNAQADRVASYLIEAGVKPGQIVGLYLPRGIELLVMQAGIAKTGAAWLPFDADTPAERIAVCLDDAK
ncbi:MAG: AMP-binding protein, partial [Polaromonas sp.]